MPEIKAMNKAEHKCFHHYGSPAAGEPKVKRSIRCGARRWISREVKARPNMMRLFKMAMTAAGLPTWLFLGVNTVFFVFMLSCPSFAMIRQIYNFNTILLPILFLVAAVAGFRTWRHRQHDRQVLRVSVIFAVIALLAWGFRVYATHIEPYRLVLREVSIETKKVSRPLRILHITDIQSAKVGSHEQKAFARMRALAPDLVIHTGDLLQPIAPARVETELPKIAALFHTLTPSLGIYGVIGDVDRRIRNAGAGDLGKMNILNNKEAIVEKDGVRVRMFGIPCEASRGRTDAAEAIRNWFNETEPSDFTIVLGHGPDYVMLVKDIPVDLCLAGHTHGGQIRIPFLGPIVTLSDVPRAWARGFRQVGSTRLNVSAGIGSEHKEKVPSLRFACPPEMTLITLVPKGPVAEKPCRATQSPGDRIVAFFVENFPPCVEAVRSYEGSAAVFLVCLLAIGAGIVMSSAVNLTRVSVFVVPLLAFACMMLEAVAPHGWDNAVLQIIPSLLAKLTFTGT